MITTKSLELYLAVIFADNTFHYKTNIIAGENSIQRRLCNRISSICHC